MIEKKCEHKDCQEEGIILAYSPQDEKIMWVCEEHFLSFLTGDGVMLLSEKDANEG